MTVRSFENDGRKDNNRGLPRIGLGGRLSENIMLSEKLEANWNFTAAKLAIGISWVVGKAV